MGMFDEFHFIGDDAKRLQCAAGHAHAHAQTKDLDNSMTHYFVSGGCVFSERFAALPVAEISKIEDNTLVITKTTVYPFVSTMFCEVVVYTHCDECDPVVYESNRHWQGNVVTEQPWCEWVLVIQNGILMSVRPERVESRDDLRKKLAENGCSPLPDDDRVARRAIELSRQKKD